MSGDESKSEASIETRVIVPPLVKALEFIPAVVAVTAPVSPANEATPVAATPNVQAPATEGTPPQVLDSE